MQADGMMIFSGVSPHLCSSDMRNAELSLPFLREPSRRHRRQLAMRICENQELVNLLRQAGVGRPASFDDPNEIAGFLSRTVRCIKSANQTIPQELRSDIPARELVNCSDVKTISALLKNGEKYSLKGRIKVDMSSIRKDFITASCLGGALLGATALAMIVMDPHGTMKQKGGFFLVFTAASACMQGLTASYVVMRSFVRTVLGMQPYDGW